MITNVASTSIDTYHDIFHEGMLKGCADQIMSVIKPGRDYSLQEICKLTGLTINNVSGRVNELKTANRLQSAFSRKCSITGRTVKPVRLPVKQGDLFA